MPPRTILAWLVLALIVTASLFFLYHIVNAAGGKENSFQEINPIVPENQFRKTVTFHPEVELVHHAEPLNMSPEVPKPMPVVVGQTEEDLRATRPVSDTPPPIEYPEPEARDPLEAVANSESEFGDNLRHPEQMIELQPPMGTLRTPVKDLGPDELPLPSHGGHQSVQYASELAQNGGEFMSGIFAFDGSDDGVGYSMI